MCLDKFSNALLVHWCTTRRLVVNRLVTELSLKPGPSCQFHSLSPSSLHDSIDIIVTLTSIPSPTVVSTFAVSNMAMSSKPNAFAGSHDQGKYELSCERQWEDCLLSSSSSSNHSFNHESMSEELTDMELLLHTLAVLQHVDPFFYYGISCLSSRSSREHLLKRRGERETSHELSRFLSHHSTSKSPSRSHSRTAQLLQESRQPSSHRTFAQLSSP